jgi:hypothetical protein
MMVNESNSVQQVLFFAPLRETSSIAAAALSGQEEVSRKDAKSPLV